MGTLFDGGPVLQTRNAPVHYLHFLSVGGYKNILPAGPKQEAQQLSKWPQQLQATRHGNVVKTLIAATSTVKTTETLNWQPLKCRQCFK